MSSNSICASYKNFTLSKRSFGPMQSIWLYIAPRYSSIFLRSASFSALIMSEWLCSSQSCLSCLSSCSSASILSEALFRSSCKSAALVLCFSLFASYFASQASSKSALSTESCSPSSYPYLTFLLRFIYFSHEACSFLQPASSTSVYTPTVAKHLGLNLGTNLSYSQMFFKKVCVSTDWQLSSSVCDVLLCFESENECAYSRSRTRRLRPSIFLTL